MRRIAAKTEEDALAQNVAIGSLDTELCVYGIRPDSGRIHDGSCTYGVLPVEDSVVNIQSPMARPGVVATVEYRAVVECGIVRGAGSKDPLQDESGVGIWQVTLFVFVALTIHRLKERRFLKVGDEFRARSAECSEEPVKVKRRLHDRAIGDARRRDEVAELSRFDAIGQASYQRFSRI